MGKRHDALITHQCDHKPWVDCLARNLRTRGFDILIVPGSAEAVGLARKKIVIATPEAVDSGWVRTEYEASLAHLDADPDFRVLPLVVGQVREVPFVGSVRWIDFRDPAPDAYRRAFYQLLCALNEREPRRTGTVDEQLEIPRPIPGLFAPDLILTPEGGERQFIEEIFDLLEASPILLLLAQTARARPELIQAIKARAVRGHGEANTLEVMPPWSRDSETDRYFARLGRQCGFSEEIRSAGHWDDALDERLGRHERLFLLVHRFENGSDSAREELAGTLHSLSERHRGSLRVLLCGGERLAELKYGKGHLSLLNHAAERRWPELTVADLRQWQERDAPALSLGPAPAAALLELCGGHPGLVAHCLRRWESEPEATIEDLREALRADGCAWHFFTPYGGDPARRDQICRWLAEDDLGAAVPWPADPLLRRLYWSNLLTVRERRFTWRCELLREIGREVLACGG